MRSLKKVTPAEWGTDYATLPGEPRRVANTIHAAFASDFCAAWPERDAEKLLGYFTDDALYHNMPMEPVTGKNGIREMLNLFIPAEDVEAEITHPAVHGNIVFTERTRTSRATTRRWARERPRPGAGPSRR